MQAHIISMLQGFKVVLAVSSIVASENQVPYYSDKTWRHTEIPYTGKFSRSFTCIISQISRFYKIYTHKSNNLYGSHLIFDRSQKFDSVKISQYTVHVSSTCTCDPPKPVDH